MDADILKSYLIKLGVQVDNDAFNKVKKLLDDFEKMIGSTSANGAAKFVKSNSMIVASLVAVDVAITKTIQAVAKADLEYTLLAQKMYISVDAAKAFKIATDTLGHSLREIAWNAELKGKYLTLVKDINDLKVPQEARDMFKQVRGIGFELDRMKMIGGRAIEMIAFNLLKLNKGEMFSISETLKKWNEYIKKNLPEWSRQIANFIQPIIQLTTSFLHFLVGIWGFFEPKVKKVYTWVKEKWGNLSVKGKEWMVFLIGAVVSFAWRLGLVATALFLIDDFMAFKNGHRSMPTMINYWKKLIEVWEAATVVSGGLAIIWDHITNSIMNTGKYTGPNSLSLEDHLKRWKYGMEEERKEKEGKKKKSGEFAVENLRTADERSTFAKLRTGDTNFEWGGGFSPETIAILKQVAKEQGVPFEYLYTLAQKESGGNPNAMNESGAVGLFQIMPKTAVGLLHEFTGIGGKDFNRFDTYQSAIGAAKYYKENKRYKSGANAIAGQSKRPVQDWEVAFLHEQGPGGNVILRAAETGDESMITDEIRNNMLSNSGGVNMSAAAFVDAKRKQYERTQYQLFKKKVPQLSIGTPLYKGQTGRARRQSGVTGFLSAEKLKAVTDATIIDLTSPGTQTGLASNNTSTTNNGPTQIIQNNEYKVDGVMDLPELMSEIKKAQKEATNELKVIQNSKQTKNSVGVR